MEQRVKTIDLKASRVEDLRVWWLDDFEEGGIFVPGLLDVEVGAPIAVRITTEQPPASAILEGTVIWRRLPQGDRGRPQRAASGAFLRAGAGIAFAPSMRSRLLFIDRVERGASYDARRGFRYPAELGGELAVRGGEKGLVVRVEDVGVRGARVSLPPKEAILPGGSVRLWVGASSGGTFATLPGKIAWYDAPRATAGVHLELAEKEDRLHWARVVHAARLDFERTLLTGRKVG